MSEAILKSLQAKDNICISHGEVPKRSKKILTTYGTVGTSYQGVNILTELSTLPISYPTVAQTVKISSDSVEDKKTTGTGAWTVEVTYLNSTYDEVIETIDMNGLTGVSLSQPAIRIQHMEIKTIGTHTDAFGDRVPVGNIWAGYGTITSGKSASVMQYIANTEVRSKHSIYTVKHEYTLYIGKIFGTIENPSVSTTASVRLAVRLHGSDIWIQTNPYTFQNNFVYDNTTIILPEKTDIQIRGKIGAGSKILTVDLDCTYLDCDILNDCFL